MLTAQPEATALKAKLFYGFSDTSRLAILEALREKPLNVSEIVERTELSQSNASNHLSCLHGCGLVSREKQGRYVIYQLSDPRVAELLQTADILLSEVARGVYECTRYELPEDQQDDSE
jgi:ArsR family transcriptional regulator, cadmium/lead-responsive transcriptional repressor